MSIVPETCSSVLMGTQFQPKKRDAMVNGHVSHVFSLFCTGKWQEMMRASVALSSIERLDKHGKSREITDSQYDPLTSSSIDEFTD